MADKVVYPDIQLVQQRVNEDNKFFMLQSIIRIPTLFAIAKEELKPEHFDSVMEAPFSILWRAVLNVAKQNNSILPPQEDKAKTLLELEATKLISGAPSRIKDNADLDILFLGSDGKQETSLISELYLGRTFESLDENYAKSILKCFLKERLMFDPLQRFVESMGNSNIPADIDTVIEKIKQNRDKVESLDVSPVEEVIPKTWESNSISQMPTNISFLDAATDGGPALGEVLVGLGGTGAGKTTLGLMIAVNGARYQVQLHHDNKPSGYWYYFSYESPITPDIRARVMSYTAEIHYNYTMKHLTSLSQLSTTDNLKDYEKQRWAKQLKSGLSVPGEKERYEAAILQLEDRLKLVDMSGTTHPSVGTKGVDEIARILQDGIVRKQQPTGIVIDYAGIMVERYMAAKGERVENEFHHLNRFVNNSRVSIASRFNCIVWVLHQLHGDAAAASPTQRQHHSRARGARNFADNANFAFNIGSKDETNNCCIITCTKHRRSDSLKDPPIVRIDGPFGMMIPEDQRYALDAGQRKIVERQIKGIVSDINLPRSLQKPPIRPNLASDPE